MAAGTYDILVEQGATFSLTITIKDQETQAPIDLTGHTFRGKIKKNFAETLPVANFTFVIPNQTTDPGKVFITIPASETALIPTTAKGTDRANTEMVYDVESEDLNGIVKRWIQGKARISPEVTK